MAFTADRLGQIAKEVPGSGPKIDDGHADPALEELDDPLWPLPFVSLLLIELLGVGLEMGTAALGAARVLVGRRWGGSSRRVLRRSSIASSA
ncbi:MAG: hypothetical protein JRF48_14095 [Deltaproteobacteria bacterium]|nr:hypothetical protein [Deltaproteobacteria bacterium]